MNGKMRVSIVATALDGLATKLDLKPSHLNVVNNFTPRNGSHSENLFSNPNVEENVLSSIDGANALKLDDKFEMSEQQEDSKMNNLEPSTSNTILEKEENTMNTNLENIPNGVSMENAAYIEKSEDNSLTPDVENLGANDQLNSSEEYTPKLFSDESEPQVENDLEDTNDLHMEKLLSLIHI